MTSPELGLAIRAADRVCVYGLGASGLPPGVAPGAVVAVPRLLCDPISLPATGGLLASAHRSLRCLEVEAQPCLGPVAETHRAELHRVRVDVVDRDVQLLASTFGSMNWYPSPRRGAPELHDAECGALRDRVDVLVVERHRSRQDLLGRGAPMDARAPAATPFGPQVIARATGV